MWLGVVDVFILAMHWNLDHFSQKWHFWKRGEKGWNLLTKKTNKKTPQNKTWNTLTKQIKWNTLQIILMVDSEPGCEVGHTFHGTITGHHAHACTHTYIHILFTPRGNLALPIHLPACFVSNSKWRWTWRMQWKLWGPWRCGAAVVPAAPPCHYATSFTSQSHQYTEYKNITSKKISTY